MQDCVTIIELIDAVLHRYDFIYARSRYKAVIN